ncbi:hypothetical protein AB0D35_09055 [Streptomyces sp. NPDC048301]|uniref:hypothetical protein n=1 Tax=Streptomyces sp. NPDC048301 TaxID=3155631 RepID=UPI0034216E6E
MYQNMLDSELRKAFDVWSSYLDARTDEDPHARARLRATADPRKYLGPARAAVADEVARFLRLLAHN